MCKLVYKKHCLKVSIGLTNELSESNLYSQSFSILKI